MENLLHWAEEHPWLAGGATLGVGLLLLWLLGFFSSGSASTSSNGNSLAAAYYNAEAAQTTSATQLQMATVAYGNQTAQAQIQANGAIAIANAQTGAATTINGQNASAATSINASNNSAAVQLGSYNSTVQQALGYDSLQATINSNADALATAQTTGYYNAQAAANAATGSEISSYLNSIAPAELAATGGSFTGNLWLPTGTFGISTTGASVTPNVLTNEGFNPTQINMIYPGYTA